MMLRYDHAMRRVAARYDRFAANDLAFVKLASTRTWLRANEYGYQILFRFDRIETGL
jgi:hypothetical protein